MLFYYQKTMQCSWQRATGKIRICRNGNGNGNGNRNERLKWKSKSLGCSPSLILIASPEVDLGSTCQMNLELIRTCTWAVTFLMQFLCKQACAYAWYDRYSLHVFLLVSTWEDVFIGWSDAAETSTTLYKTMIIACRIITHHMPNLNATLQS